MSSLAQSRRDEARPSLRDVFASPRFFWVMLGLFLVAHIILRLWETPNLAKNDVQEAIAAQTWSWGYHPRNPPLHTWLLMSSYAVFGERLMAHVVLRYALLGATISLAYACGRELLSGWKMAALSALALTLLAPFAWTVHTALTHTLLLAAINLAALWMAIRLTRRQRMADFILFGAVIALGLLAKYSFLLFLLPLLAAMLAHKELRAALMTPRIFLTLGVALVLFAPHGVWMLREQFDFVAFLAEKQRSAEPSPYLVEILTGLGALSYAAVAFLIPLVLVLLSTFAGAFKAKAGVAPSAWESAIRLLIVSSIGLLVLDVLVLRASSFEQRYMMCALITAPMAAFLWLDRRGPSPRALNAFTIGALAIGAIVLMALPARAMLSQRSCHRCWEEMATETLVREIRLGGFVDGTIIADHYNLAGNLRLAFPHSRIYAGNYQMRQQPFNGTGTCLLAWDARNAGDALPESIASMLAERRLRPVGAPVFVEAHLRRSTRMDRLAYWTVPNADANCFPR